MLKKVRYIVNPWTTEHLCSAGEGFSDFQKATALAKEEAAYYGAAVIDKMVWEDGKLVKKETGILKADGTFGILNAWKKA